MLRGHFARARYRHTTVGSDHVACVFCDACPCSVYTARVVVGRVELRRLIEDGLVPCRTETGELELENWVGID
jgi:hypothetical protein